MSGGEPPAGARAPSEAGNRSARAAGDAPPAVAAEGLTRDFGRFRAVDGLTLSVAAGEVFGLLGSNGAGKSTAIRMLCGLLKPSSGRAAVLGVDVASDPEGVKRRIGYMTQKFSLYQELTVRQNLHFFGGIYGLGARALRAREAWAVEQAGLRGKENLLAGALPGGWRQRLALACALLHGPRVVFLDEPTAGVDPIARRAFWEVIAGLAADGVTVIVTTHYLDEAEHCDRIGLLHAGRLVRSGTVSEMKGVFAGRAILEVSCPRPLQALELLEREPWVHEAAPFGSRLHLVVRSADESRRAALDLLTRANLGPASVERIVPSLEDVFIHTLESLEKEGRGA